MDLTTIIGFLVGLGLIINGIALDTSNGISYVIGNVVNFLDAPSAIIVIGGTIAAIVANYPATYLKEIPNHFKIIMNGNKFNPMEYIDTLVEFAQIARRNGHTGLCWHIF